MTPPELSTRFPQGRQPARSRASPGAHKGGNRAAPTVLNVKNR